ncbi:MAG: DUF1553 domain-containing protein, partial [Planctomycetes bacterium]|nr:DUF1553 domain-containing protein [Planctomycetota bacterium]
AGAWLRRAALDLTGIPPTLEELESFETAAARDWDAATAAAVERLLDSPRHGERMAQWWLDLARYADTNGYEKDAPRTIWPWRDWVIGAFASDLPFDRFTIEQLAGDLLPEPTRAQLVATGFHRNTLTNEEGGTDDEEFRVAAVVDRANTTAQLWLGSTLACAQCHDHKYDPFSQREYYEFYAFFDQTEDGGKQLEPLLEVADDEHVHAEERLRAALAETEAGLARAADAIDARQQAWELRARAELGPEPVWRPLEPHAVNTASGARALGQLDAHVLIGGELPDRDTYRIEFSASESVRALRIEALPNAAFPQGGASRSDNANFALSEVRLERDGASSARFTRADADRRQAGANSSPANAIDGAADTHWIVDGAAPAALILVLDEALPASSFGHVLVLEFQSDWPRHQLGSFRVLASADETLASTLPQGPDGYPWQVRTALRTPVETLGDEQRELVRADFRTRVDAQARELVARIDAAREALDTHRASVPRTPILRRRAQPRTTHVHAKGSFLSPLEEVRPDVPAVFPPLEADAPRDRLGLARWLVARENPLTARVIANRLWERLFGRGLVATLDDFGTRGDPPTHPELLDHLALRLVELGWSLQAFQRELLLSSTYAQTSCAPREAYELDPDNAWLARASRPRLEIETLRDQALALSGLLFERVGGPSVRPPQPTGVEQHVYSDDAWVDAQGPDRHRRGLYTFWKRSSPYGTFATFDAPSRELACTRRARTNTPLQALALLNDPAFDECARALGRRLLERAGDDRARLAAGFRLATARAPSAEELERLVEQLAAELHDLRELAEPEREPAAWARVATVLLNLDEAQCRN